MNFEISQTLCSFGKCFVVPIQIIIWRTRRIAVEVGNRCPLFSCPDFKSKQIGVCLYTDGSTAGLWRMKRQASSAVGALCSLKLHQKAGGKEAEGTWNTRHTSVFPPASRCCENWCFSLVLRDLCKLLRCGAVSQKASRVFRI